MKRWAKRILRMLKMSSKLDSGSVDFALSRWDYHA